MKELALGAAMLGGVTFSNYEVAYMPDTHMELMSARNCDGAATDPEMFSDEFERFLCEAAQDISYDSVHCFMSAIMLQKKHRDEGVAGEQQQRETIDETKQKTLTFYCGSEPCGGDDRRRINDSDGQAGQTH